MKTLVLYSTKTGNTKKIAQAIATETNSDLFQVSNPDPTENVNLNDYDLIFVGTAYGQEILFPKWFLT